MQTAAEFRIPYTQYLDHESNVVRDLPEFAKDTELLVKFYKNMVLSRQFDSKMVALQRTGQMGTYPSALGQEAIGIGIGSALQPEDIFVPYYRDVGAKLLRGVQMLDIMLYWGGDERGNNYQSNIAAMDFPDCVPIATQATHAAGIATALKIREEKGRAVLMTIGDGGTSKGDFMESLNVAGAWHLPVVFVVCNNQWAISVPRHMQSGAGTLAQKAIAAGIPGEQVDGNDPIAVYDAVSRSLQRARKDKGAKVLELVSYRLHDHTTADDATRYRSKDEVNNAWEKEPVKRLQTYLHKLGAWSPEQETEWLASCKQQVEDAVEEYKKSEPQDPGTMFDFIYQETPTALEEQRQHLEEKIARMPRGGGHG